MKLFPQKSGHGHITASRATLGSAEARRAGFLNDHGTPKKLEKIVDEENHTITIRIAKAEGPGNAD